MDKNIFTRVKIHMKSKNFTFNESWLRECIQYFIKTHPKKPMEMIQSFTIEQWLLSDLREINNENGCLPKNLVEQKVTMLNGCYILQIEKMYDISTSKYKQLSNIRKVNIENLEATKEEKSEIWEPKKKRMYQLYLSDGLQEIQAIEYKPINLFNDILLPGNKIKLIGPVMCRRGIILLEEENIISLAGEIEDLLIKNSVENIFARYLNLEENPDPYNDMKKETESVKTDLDEEYLNDLEKLARSQDSKDREMLNLLSNTLSQNRQVTSKLNIEKNSMEQDKCFSDDELEALMNDPDLVSEFPMTSIENGTKNVKTNFKISQEPLRERLKIENLSNKRQHENDHQSCVKIFKNNFELNKNQEIDDKKFFSNNGNLLRSWNFDEEKICNYGREKPKLNSENEKSDFNDSQILNDSISNNAIENDSILNKSIFNSTLNKSIFNDSTLNKPVFNDSTLNKPIFNDSTLNKPIFNDPTLNKPILNESTLNDDDVIIIESSDEDEKPQFSKSNHLQNVESMDIDFDLQIQKLRNDFQREEKFDSHLNENKNLDINEIISLNDNIRKPKSLGFKGFSCQKPLEMEENTISKPFKPLFPKFTVKKVSDTNVGKKNTNLDDSELFSIEETNFPKDLSSMSKESKNEKENLEISNNLDMGPRKSNAPNRSDTKSLIEEKSMSEDPISNSQCETKHLESKEMTEIEEKIETNNEKYPKVCDLICRLITTKLTDQKIFKTTKALIKEIHKLSYKGGIWKLTGLITDGTANLKIEFSSQFLEKILEISPLEISALKKKAKTDPKLELKLKNSFRNGQQKLEKTYWLLHMELVKNKLPLVVEGFELSASEREIFQKRLKILQEH